MNSPEKSSNSAPPDVVDRLERIGLLIPGIIETGNGFDSEAPFPAVSYHAYTDRKDFAHNDFFAGDTTGTNSQYLGPGLYCGSQELAEQYASYFERRGKITGVERIISSHALLIDVDNPAVHSPLTPIAKASVLDYIAAKKAALLRSDQQKAVELDEFASFIVGERHQREPTAYDLVMGNAQFAYKKSVAIDSRLRNGYLMSIGIDGATAIVRPRVAHYMQPIIAFWRREHVADESTWQKRFDRSLKVGRIFTEVGACVAADSVAEPGEHVRNNTLPKKWLAGLHETGSLSVLDAQVAVAQFQKKSEVVSVEQAGLLFAELKKPQLDSFELVRLLAAMDPALDTVLRAETGVWEGYRLHEHTQAVLNQFNNNYAGNLDLESSGSRNGIAIARLTLLLHDMGKPLVHALGSKAASQDTYNRLIVKRVVENMPLGDGAKALVADITMQDYLGSMLQKGEPAIDETAQKIVSFLDRHEDTLPAETLYQLLFIIHECDASAYTDQAYYVNANKQKAYCKPGLNKVFMTDDTVKRVKHRRRQQQLIERLGDRINELYEES